MLPQKNRRIPQQPAPVLSMEARIERSVQGYRTYHPSGTLTCALPVPERRKLAIGDSVIYGALKDCKVEALHLDGRLVTISHDNRSAERPLMTIHWSGIQSVERGSTSFAVVNEVTQALVYTTSTLDSLVIRFAEGGCADNADYQRGYAWTDEDKDRYIDTLFNGGSPGAFIVVRSSMKADQILDGKQRLNAVTELYLGNRAYRGKYWDEFSFMDQHHLLNRMISVCMVKTEHYSRAQLLQMFLLVNTAGVPQTEEHLQKVRGLLAHVTAQAVTSETAPVAGPAGQ